MMLSIVEEEFSECLKEGSRRRKHREERDCIAKRKGWDPQ